MFADWRVSYRRRISVGVITVCITRETQSLIGNDPKSAITRRIWRVDTTYNVRHRHAKIRCNTRPRCHCAYYRADFRCGSQIPRLDEAAKYVGQEKVRNCTSANKNRPLAVFRLLRRRWRKVWDNEWDSRMAHELFDLIGALNHCLDADKSLRIVIALSIIP